MNSNIRSFFGALLVLIGNGNLNTSFADDSLVLDMIKFDQHYIPALAFTSDEKLAQSRNAMHALLPVWQSFQQRIASSHANDKLWQTDFNAVNNYISKATKIVTSGQNLKDAHEALEQIRIVLMELRHRNNVDYYIDYLTRFHEPMENIELAGKGKTVATFQAQHLDTIRHTLPQAKQLWMAMKRKPFEAKLYGFNQERAKLLRSLINQEMLALDKLEKTLASNDKQAIIYAAVAIKPNFARIFKMFGRFSET